MSMKTNANLTIYNKYVDPSTRSEKYQRAQIGTAGSCSVEWENRKAANVLRTGGQIAADQARVFIPFTQGANYTQPRAWQALTVKIGKWTLQEGDVIVKDLVADEIGTSFTMTALKAKYDDVLVISSVDTFDMGSLSMQHWQVGAK
jgi:hypothetical protein